MIEKLFDVQNDGSGYGILRCVGITRPELEYAQQKGSMELLARLKEAGVHPHKPQNAAIIVRR